MHSTMVSNTNRAHHQYHSSTRTHHKSHSSNHSNASNVSLSSQDGSSSSNIIYVEDQDDDGVHLSGHHHEDSNSTFNTRLPVDDTLINATDRKVDHAVTVHSHSHSHPSHPCHPSQSSRSVPVHSTTTIPEHSPHCNHSADRSVSSLHVPVARQSHGMQYFTNHAINAPPSNHLVSPHSAVSSPSKSRIPHYGRLAQSQPHHSSLFGHDYTKNWLFFSKLNSAADYYSNTKLPFNLGGDAAKKCSDCPSDTCSLDSRRKKVKRSSSRMRRLFCVLKRANSICVEMVRVTFEFGVTSCHRVQKWQKELHEQPLEVKEKYFFVASTVISTVLFYILFLCLDFMIRHWFALPLFIVRYSFSISYCISYLTSVIWQHFFNQYFVFAMARTTMNNHNPHNYSASLSSDAFCDSLLRTYVVYGTSLLFTGIIGSVLQIYAGLADEFVLVLTLPMSGVMNYYLLRYCHHREQHQYHAVPTTDAVYHSAAKSSSRGVHGGHGAMHKNKRNHHHGHHRDRGDHTKYHRHSHSMNKMNKTKTIKSGKYGNINMAQSHHNGQHQDDIVIV